VPVSGRRPSAGPVLLLAGLLVLGVGDAVVIGLVSGYFGGGFNSPVLRGPAAVAAFALSGAVLDAFLLASLFSLAWGLGRVFRLGGSDRLAFAGGVSLFVPLAFDLVSHRLHRVFGHVIGFDVLVQLAGGRLSDAALEAATEAPASALLLVGGVATIAGAVLLARRAEPRLNRWLLWRPPSPRGLGRVVLASALGGTFVLAVVARGSTTLAYGLEQKPSALLLRFLIQTASDVDFDGAGLLSRPPDPAAWDAARYPFAPEVPGNGIDENGLAGDGPPDFQPTQPVAAPPRPGGPRRPWFLLVFLESFRGDVVGRRLHDREVTPVLNQLAREGASSERAYAHTPFTWPSRAQLFQGRVAPRAGAPTLIDDFHSLGYRVAYFSGQNDMHGGSDVLVGFERAEFHYDARSDRDRRTSRTALPVSLQVSWDVVLERVRGYLDASADDPRSLFLYVNLVDNHYPYHHDGLEKLLGVEPVERSEIRLENARRVFETYLQACANVDRAVGELVTLWRARSDGAPLLVTADHGQAFYENGMLGHGAVDAIQSRVPLIVVGVGGVWPEPLGLSDLRGLVLTHLFQEPGRARFEPDPARALFQYTGLLERPAQVALRRLDGAASWHFATGRGANADDPTLPAPDDQALRRVLWTWEHWQREALSQSAPR
jgi:hypothetical protein